MDEIFGRKNFVANVVWENRYSRSNDAILSLSHNSILLYATNPDKWKKVRNRLERTEEQASQYKNPDNDPNGLWRAIPWDAPNLRPNLSYPIITPKGNTRLPPPGRCWSRTEDQWLQIVKSGLAYFGKSGEGAPSFKQYLKDATAIVPNTWWSHEDAGHTDEAKKEIHGLFGKDQAFETPKPERLIQRILQLATNENDLVLDSFLGSGTTAAVAHKMGRRYIGIEIGEHAVTHIVPRLRKVIEGEQGGISEAVGWKGGGGFSFYRLGETIFNLYGAINPKIKFPALAQYIWFMETGLSLHSVGTGRDLSLQNVTPLIGIYNDTAYYLLYNGILGDKSPEGGNALTRSLLAELPAFEGKKIIFGESCRISPDKLKDLQITFKQIPYDLKVK